MTKQTIQTFRNFSEQKNTHYQRAYIIFFDETDKTILLGQELYGAQRFTNLGGGKEPMDFNQPIRTALRELLEELFEWHLNVKDKSHLQFFNDCLEFLKQAIKSRKKYHNYQYTNDKYIQFFLEISALEYLLLKIKQHYKIQTELYSTFPNTIHQLVQNRIIRSNQEIGELKLFSVHDNKHNLFKYHFLKYNPIQTPKPSVYPNPHNLHLNPYVLKNIQILFAILI